MNTAPRFLIAKYVEDVRRMEPRNIGVIPWAGLEPKVEKKTKGKKE
jgi:hypothetical protein